MHRGGPRLSGAAGEFPADPLQHGLYLGIRHEHLPAEPRAVVLDHADDGPLVDRQVTSCKPVPLQVEGVAKSELSPQSASILMVVVAAVGAMVPLSRVCGSSPL